MDPLQPATAATQEHYNSAVRVASVWALALVPAAASLILARVGVLDRIPRIVECAIQPVAAGAMAADVFLRQLPRLIKQQQAPEALTGYLCAFAAGRLVGTHGHNRSGAHGDCGARNIVPLALASWLHAAAHGVVLAGAYAGSHSNGVATTTALLFHEVPHYVADAAVLHALLHSAWLVAAVQTFSGLGTLFGYYAVNAPLGVNTLQACAQGALLHMLSTVLLPSAAHGSGAGSKLQAIGEVFLVLCGAFILLHSTKV